MAMLGTVRFIMHHPIAKHTRWRSLCRFFWWQTISRLHHGEFIYPWINNSKLAVRCGDHGLTGNIYCGLHEPAEMGFVLMALRPGELFVDVGANMGSYTVLAGAAVGARVIALEPHPTNFARLKRNIEVNGIESRVTAVNAAAGATPGTLRFSGESKTTSHLLGPHEEDNLAISVPVTTLDELLGNENPTIIKIDVEGYEGAVLSGANATLQKSSLRAVIAELNGRGARYGFNEPAIRTLLADAGFRPCLFTPTNRQLVESQTKGPDDDNVIYVRDVQQARRLAAAAPQITVLGGYHL